VVLIGAISFASFNISGAFVISSPAAIPTVYVVDDDFDVLSSLRFLLETEGFEVKAFGSGSAFLLLPLMEHTASSSITRCKI
jgi:hypothetical protein